MMKWALNHWNPMRLVRFLLGAAAAVQGAMQAEVFWIAAGSFLVLGALLNAGCCGSTGCSVLDAGKQQKDHVKIKKMDALK